MRTRFPIKRNLLDCALFEIERRFAKKTYTNFYNKTLYLTMFLTAYFGMFRIGEYTSSPHIIKAKDVHMAIGKHRKQVVIYLYSSKTHTKADMPQKVIIEKGADPELKNSIYCPYVQINRYRTIRPPYRSNNEQFFVFSDGQLVTQAHFRETLREIITKLGLDSNVFEPHSFRIGRATDLMKLGYSVDTIKQMGRWKSNAVYKYLRL